MSKRIGGYLLTGIFLVWVVALLAMVTSSGIGAFHFLLSRTQGVIGAHALFMRLLMKLMMSTVLLTLGVACVALYFSSYESVSFLDCSWVILLAAGIISTNVDLDAMFYTPVAQRMPVMVSGGAMLILFPAAISNLMLKQIAPLNRPALRIVNSLVGVVAAAYIMGEVPMRSTWVLECYAMYLLAVILAVLAIAVFSQKERRNALLALAFLLPVYCLLLLEGGYRYQAVTWQFAFLVDTMPYLLSVHAIALFVVVYQHQRIGLLMGRQQSRRFQQSLRHKANLTKMLIGYVSEPLSRIVTYNRAALKQHVAEANAPLTTLLRKTENEINVLTQHLDNIMEYDALPHASSMRSKIRSSLSNVFNYVEMEMKRFDIHWDWSMPMARQGDDANVLCDPYALIRANQVILSALTPLRRSKTLLIDWLPDGAFYLVTISAYVDVKNHYFAIQKFKRTLTRRSQAPAAANEEDFTLRMAYRVLANHASPPKVSILKNGIIQVQYLLSAWDDSRKEDGAQARPVVEVYAKEKPLVVLISTATEQIEMVRAHLMYEEYTLIVFTSDQEALAYIRGNSTIDVIVMGKVFLRMSDRALCAAIREEFSLGQLPILLIRERQEQALDESLLNLVNDVVVEPFVQVLFLQKIKSLVMLKKSIGDTMKAKLDFLQAQMDPHFIFNTLNTIMPLCIQEPTKAYDLLGYFSDYLRASLFSRELQQPIPVAQKLDMIVAYLTIEQTRFGEKIQYESHLDFSPRCHILPLMIEPIVENCVKHGVKDGSAIHIIIEMEERENELFVCVADDGAGIPEALLGEIVAQTPTHSSRSIGLNNVMERLKLYYGRKLYIESRVDEGTRVWFSVPVHD